MLSMRNSVLTVNFGLKRIKAAIIWLVDVNTNFVTNVVVPTTDVIVAWEIGSSKFDY